MCTGNELCTQVILVLTVELVSCVPLLVQVSTPGEGSRDWEVQGQPLPCGCPVADRIVKQNCDAICLNCQWLERDTAAIEE